MKTYLLIAAAVVIQPAASLAQTTPAGAGFQQAQAVGYSDGVVAAVGGRGGRGGLTIGRPYSATAVTHTVQTLADGSQIETTRSQALYRDDQGRTRTELNDGKSIQIADRAAGITYSMDTATKTARAVEMISVGRGGGVKVNPTESAATANGTATATAPRAAVDNLRDAMVQLDMLKEGMAAGQATRRPNLATEDLGTQSFDGVQAHGVRTTSTIPVGAIGNNRELKTVSDLWESKDLGIIIKSVSTDPRFGTTTYELTNISRSEPDPSLFRVPADYTILQAPKRN
jgi:hypothetical protein